MTAWNFAAAGLGAAANLFGAKMSADSSNKAARLNAIAAANQAEIDYTRYLEARDRDERLQREFAQSGVQWRVEDAQKAGIHPLAALGAQTSSYSSNVGVPSAQTGARPFAGASMGSGLAAAGQDISRAMQATRTTDQRTEAYNRSIQDLSVQRMGLENDLLASQVAKNLQPSTGPGFPSSSKRLLDGQGDSSLVKDEALKRTALNPNANSQEPGPVTDIGFTRTQTGYAPVYSKDAKERLEDDTGGMIAWNLRNRIMPMFGLNYNIPDGKKQGSDGKYYFFNPFTQEYSTTPYRGSNPEKARGYSNYMRTN